MLTGAQLSTTILAIGAHPDDIEYGCHGFLLKQKKLGSSIHSFVASLGSAGDPSSGPGRQQESLLALEVSCGKNITFREKTGITHADFNDTVAGLFACIQAIKPDIILTHSVHDTHQEHRLVHELTLAAARRSKASILAYAILSNTLEFMPTFFVDIQHEFSAKKEALTKHISQRDKYYMSTEYLDIFHSHNYASLHGIRHSEAYEILRFFA